MDNGQENGSYSLSGPPPPVLVATRDDKDYIRAALYS